MLPRVCNDRFLPHSFYFVYCHPAITRYVTYVADKVLTNKQANKQAGIAREPVVKDEFVWCNLHGMYTKTVSHGSLNGKFV